MTKEHELQILEIIVNDKGLSHGYYEFWEKYRYQFNFHFDDLVKILNKYYDAGDLDQNFNLTSQFYNKYELLKIEVEDENKKRSHNQNIPFDQSEMITKQKEYFWVPTIISVLALLISMYALFLNTSTPIESTNEKTLFYIDSIRTLIQNDINTASVEVLDIIYGDTTIVK